MKYAVMIVLLVAASLGSTAIQAQEKPPGANVESLLDYARTRNPEYTALRLEAEAAGERAVPAGALPDPRLRTELMDITKSGQQDATLSPSRTGSARYTLMQEIPWFGKRDLKREIAEFEAEGAEGKALGSWAEIAARIKSAYAQRFYLDRNELLTREILDLMIHLEKVAQARYAGGLSAQQDVIRAQVEQTGMQNELIALNNEQRRVQARLNALLGRGAVAPLAAPVKLRMLPPPARLDYATLEERVRARNPQLFTDESRLRAAEKNRDLTYKNRYPDVTVGIAPNQVRNSIKQWNLMVELNIPFQQSSRRAQEREAEAMLSAAKARKEATANQLLSELSESLAGMEAARQTENLTRTSLLPQAELSFRAALAGYENGKLDFATLLDAQRQIRLARQSQIKAEAEAQVRLAEIERLLGEEL